MNMSTGFKTIRSSLCFSAALLALSACSSGESESTIQVAADGGSELTMTRPSFLDSRAVVVENLLVDVTINGQRVETVRSGDEWTGQTIVPQGSDVSLVVLWSEMVNSNRLPLAEARESVTSINTDVRFEVNDGSYVFNFDADLDTVSNIEERRQNTDPFDADSPGGPVDIEPLVKVPPSDGPVFNVVDAVFDADFWNNAQFRDTSGVDGSTLFIDSLIVDEIGNNVVGTPNYQWAAIHDEEFLSLFIFGKSLSPPAVNATRDSGALMFNDDSLEIFFDGDFSRSRSYDAVDDMHIMIPLVRGVGASAQANKSGEVDSEIRRGDNVNALVEFDLDGVEFATCLCTGERVIWEVKINLADAGIPVGRTFGFEIQINQDDDGGARDSKWAWFSPERSEGDTNVETDLTWRFPNTMGTMELLPFPE